MGRLFIGLILAQNSPYYAEKRARVETGPSVWFEEGRRFKSWLSNKDEHVKLPCIWQILVHLGQDFLVALAMSFQGQTKGFSHRLSPEAFYLEMPVVESETFCVRSMCSPVLRYRPIIKQHWASHNLKASRSALSSAV